MKPGTLNLDIYRGDHVEVFFRLRERVYDPNANFGEGAYVAGDYINLTGYTAAAQIRAKAMDNAVLAVFEASIPADTLETRGSVLLTMHTNVTSTLPVDMLTGIGLAVWDCQLTNSQGHPRTYMAGAVNIIADVTR